MRDRFTRFAADHGSHEHRRRQHLRVHSWCKRQPEALHANGDLGHDNDLMLPYCRETASWKLVFRALQPVNSEGISNLDVPGEDNCPHPVLLAKLDHAVRIAGSMIEGITGEDAAAILGV